MRVFSYGTLINIGLNIGVRRSVVRSFEFDPRHSRLGSSAAMATLLSSGVQAMSTNRAQSPLAQPQSLVIKNGTTGQLVASVTPVKNTSMYLTFESWKTSTQRVNECRACHFQEGNVPDGKKMPTIPFERNGKTTTRAMTNQLAFHVNCNTCHDAAAALRPALKMKPGFATSKECTKCHKAN